MELARPFRPARVIRTQAVRGGLRRMKPGNLTAASETGAQLQQASQLPRPTVRNPSATVLETGAPRQRNVSEIPGLRFCAGSKNTADGRSPIVRYRLRLRRKARRGGCLRLGQIVSAPAVCSATTWTPACMIPCREPCQPGHHCQVRSRQIFRPTKRRSPAASRCDMSAGGSRANRKHRYPTQAYRRHKPANRWLESSAASRCCHFRFRRRSGAARTIPERAATMKKNGLCVGSGS